MFSKYIASFDYFGQSLIVLFTSSASIASFVTVIGTPVGIANVRFNFKFSITIGIVKK